MTITLDGTNGITSPNETVTGQFSSGSTMGFKNRIINGDMVIDQRNAGASVTPNGTYTLDRWVTVNTQTSKFTIQQNAGSVTPPVGFSNYLGVTSSSAYSITATDLFSIETRIEGYNISDLAWGTASAKALTLSFQVYSSLTGTFGGVIQNSAQNRNYPFNFTVASANTWTTVAIAITGDTSGTWLTTNGIGIRVVFSLGTGATYSGTAGAWSGTYYNSATGAVSVVGTSGATFYITGVQLEKGSTATSFDYRPYGTEFQLCQRYYETGTAYGEGYQSINAPIGIGGKFQVIKRATPTMIYPTFTNITNARVGADRAIFTDSYARYCLANATAQLGATETFTASAEL